MNVTLELKPEIERRVTQEASALGLSLEAYLTALIERLPLPDMERPTLAEFEADMDLLAEDSDRLPILPAEAYSRASIYADHD